MTATNTATNENFGKVATSFGAPFEQSRTYYITTRSGAANPPPRSGFLVAFFLICFAELCRKRIFIYRLG